MIEMLCRPCQLVKDLKLQCLSTLTLESYSANIHWESGDTFVFVIKQILKGISKRDLLSSTCQVLSPMGILNPTIVYAKQLVHETCRQKLGWDDNLPADILDKWNLWREDLPNLQSLKVPRCLLPPGTTSPSKDMTLGFTLLTGLHLRVLRSDDVWTTLILSKGRMCPIKKS